jgi:hypothetical protein
VQLALQAVPSQFSDSLFHCGAAIGGLFLGIYQVAYFTFILCKSLSVRLNMLELCRVRRLDAPLPPQAAQGASRKQKAYCTTRMNK